MKKRNVNYTTIRRKTPTMVDGNDRLHTQTHYVEEKEKKTFHNLANEAGNSML